MKLELLQYLKSHRCNEYVIYIISGYTSCSDKEWTSECICPYDEWVGRFTLFTACVLKHTCSSYLLECKSILI